jgi:hypothetical protein
LRHPATLTQPAGLRPLRLSSDYSEIKIKLKFAPDSVAPNFEADWNKPPTMPMLVAIRSEEGSERNFLVHKTK